MPSLSAADREYLSQQWRWTETYAPAVRTRHPEAREAEYPTAFITVAGANIALQIIDDATMGERRMVVATADGILPVNFRGRPSTVRFLTHRFGYDIITGRLMLTERADFDYGTKITTLYLTG